MSDSSKLSKIAELFGLMEKSKKGKDWILIETKRHGYKVRSSLTVFEILKTLPENFIAHLIGVLTNKEVDSIDFDIDGKSITKTFHWFFTDIIGSANPNILTKDQARKVWALNELIGRTDSFKQRNIKSDVMSITGDGMVIGFSDYPEKPILLSIELHKLISKYNEHRRTKDQLNIRIGIDSGPVYFIKDLTGKDNFWGPGVIMTRRIMDLARPKQILVSSQTANELGKLTSEYKSMIHYCGEYKIKHGEKISVYNIYGKNLGNKLCPKNKLDSSLKLVPRFLFPKIELKLDIKEQKKMMTHHTWIWHLVNIADSPTDQVSYYLNGDVPREFSDLHLSVKDPKGQKLQISSVNTNKPLEKEFMVKLARPLKQNRQTIIQLEYDWEEPERKFQYSLATDCKKFVYTLTVPKHIQIKPRVLKVDATRVKTYASPSPETRYLKDKTEVTWKAKDLNAHDIYQFEW